MTKSQHGMVLLAAGASQRFGSTKQLLCWQGEPLVCRMARLGLTTCPVDAIAVLGAKTDEVALALAHLPLRLVQAEAWQQGMGASLLAGLNALDARCAGALVVLCDQPALSTEHLQRLVEQWRNNPTFAVASAYAGVIGVPAILPRSWFTQLDGRGDYGARDLLRSRKHEVQVVHAEELTHDIDTPDAYIF